MDFFVNYWPLILVAIAVIVVGGYGIYVFAHRPTTEQISKVKEWLLYAVTEAEKNLGSGTGEIKLRYVYDMFIARFPFLVKIIRFESFKILVDEVLDQFRDLLKNNDFVQEYVATAKPEHIINK